MPALTNAQTLRMNITTPKDIMQSTKEAHDAAMSRKLSAKTNGSTASAYSCANPLTPPSSPPEPSVQSNGNPAPINNAQYHHPPHVRTNLHGSFTTNPPNKLNTYDYSGVSPPVLDHINSLLDLDRKLYLQAVQINNLSALSNNLSVENASLAAQRTGLSATNAGLTDTVRSKETECQVLRATVKEAETKNGKQQAVYEQHTQALLQQLEQKKKAHQDLQAECDDLTKRLQKAKDVEKHHETLKRESTKLEKQLVDTADKLSNSRSQIAALEAKLASSAKLAQQYEAELKAAKLELATHQTTITTLETNLQSEVTKSARLRDAFLSAADALENLEKRYAQVAAYIQQLGGTMQVESAHIKTLLNDNYGDGDGEVQQTVADTPSKEERVNGNDVDTSAAGRGLRDIDNAEDYTKVSEDGEIYEGDTIVVRAREDDVGQAGLDGRNPPASTSGSGSCARAKRTRAYVEDEEDEEPISAAAKRARRGRM